MGTPAGCVVCRTVKRRPREDAADPVFFNSIRGVRPDDSDEHMGSKKLKLSELGSLPSGAPMSVGANLSSDDMRVEFLLQRFERGRVANTLNIPVLNWMGV